MLANIAETAPETWGDEGMTKGATYDERSDVFSFAILLWRLFSSLPEDPSSPSSSSSSPSPRSSQSSPRSPPSSPPSVPSSPRSPPPSPRYPQSSPRSLPSSPPSSPSSSPSFPPFPSSPTSFPSSPPSFPPFPPSFPSSPPSFPSSLENKDPECDPYGHLRDRKGQLNLWTLRNKIREGERPIIKSTWPPEIQKLIKDCWQFDPTLRPFFSLILLQLHAFYHSLYGNDEYLTQGTPIQMNEIANPLQLDLQLSNSPTPILSLENWSPKPQLSDSECAIVSLLQIEGFLWAGTNMGTILIINPKTLTLDGTIPLQNSKGRVSLVYSGRSCIWASCETEKIIMIHAKTRSKVVEIDNEFPVICMAISYHHAGPSTPVVWVSDTRGFVSLWDLTTLQKFCKFLVLDGSYPPVVRSMSVMHEHIWMAGGSDIVVIETQTLHKTVQSSGAARINGITTIPNTQQAWTCSKDGTVTLWTLKSDILTNTQAIVKLKTTKRDTEVKFVQTLSSFPGGHAVSGDFNGKLTMWNTESFEEPVEFPMPQESSMHALQCALDAGELGLWIGTMNLSCPLMRYHTS